MGLLEEVWDNSSFTTNQERLLEHDTARLFFHTIAGLAQEKGWMSDAHFTVDGTLTSLASLQERVGMPAKLTALGAKRRLRALPAI